MAVGFVHGGTHRLQLPFLPSGEWADPGTGAVREGGAWGIIWEAEAGTEGAEWFRTIKPKERGKGILLSSRCNFM